MYAVAVKKPGILEIVWIPKPEVGPYDALIKNEIGFICNATDRKVIEGHFPGIALDAYPVLLGHETVGRVVELGNLVTSFAMGDRVIGGLLLDSPEPYGSAWGADAEFVLVKDHLAMQKDGCANQAHGWNESFQIMKKVDDSLPIEAAGLLCTWREVYAGLFHDFQLKQGADIVVFGAGPVGLSFIRFARLGGLGRIVCVESVAGKREKALKMGADAVFAPEDPELYSSFGTRDGKCDAVIDAVGSEVIINAGLPLLRMGGAVCVYGVVGAQQITIDKHKAPYNFNLLFHQWPTRVAESAAQDPVVSWVKQGVLNPNDFVTGRFSIKDISEAVAETKKPLAIKTLLRFDEWI